MTNNYTKASQIIFLLLFIYAAVIIGIGIFYTWPNLEAINESRSRSVGIWNAWSQALVSFDARYTTNFLHSINPLTWGCMLGYKIMPVMGIVLFLAGCYLFFSSLFKSPKQLLIFVLCFTVVHFALSPSIVYELFNMISSFVYLWGTCFWLIWTGAAIKCYVYATGKHKNWWFLTAVVFLALSMGTNEMFLVINAITITAIAGIAYMQKSILRVMPLLAAGVLTILFFFGCSGSMQRIVYESQSHGADYLRTEAFHFAGHYISAFKQLFGGCYLLFPVFLILVISLPLRDEFSIFLNKPVNRRIIFTAFTAVVLLAALPFYLFKGSFGTFPERVFSTVMQYVQLLLAFLIIIIAQQLPRIKSLAKYNTLFAGYILFAMAVGENNFTGIIKEWQSGAYEKFNAQSYSNYRALSEASHRHTSYKFAEITTIPQEVLLIHAPSTAFPDGYNAYSRVLEGYYQLDEVRIQSDTISKYEILVKALCQ